MFRIQGLEFWGFRVSGLGLGMEGQGSEVRNLGRDLGFGVWGLGFGVWGLGHQGDSIGIILCCNARWR